MALFLITGASGTGKTYIAHILKKFGYWEECISHTTRAMRKGEVDGETYYFIDKQAFEEAYENDEFIERVEYHDNFYGISKEEIKRALDAGKNVFIIIEYNGFKQIKEQYPDAIGIFLHMSKEECMANMLLRGDKFEKAMNRISTYEDEMKNSGEYDYVIKNVYGAVDCTVDILKIIIKSHNI